LARDVVTSDKRQDACRDDGRHKNIIHIAIPVIAMSE
jgi:hypothetical protein